MEGIIKCTTYTADDNSGMLDIYLTELQSGTLQNKEINVITELYNCIVTINTLANACLGM